MMPALLDEGACIISCSRPW